ncbi:cell wall hydrolase [Novosphingobium sp.]|uniref:cell wall hydrolase n=1 Tax=Novosphingobium sp. TaxID=1874826 RepID=UPI0035AF2196
MRNALLRPNPLLREVTIMLLAALPMLLLVLACQAGGHRRAPDPVGQELAALPAQALDAPLLITPQSASDMDAARARNAADPFYQGAIAPARPFRFAGTTSDFANAADCLALAALAEAGGSDVGQRAVIQVVLNRVRHPAFARTVCGTVFEGSERATGCQFSFTCDGALARKYGDDAWKAARARGEAALKGYVFKPVGTATHYHTDWVYPAWSPKLVKIAQVETHLFFRWPGYWGTSAAASMAYRGGEPRLADLIGAANDTPASEAAPTPKAELPADTPKVASGSVMLRDPTGKANFLLLQGGAGPADALAAARALCNRAGTCRVYGWLDAGAVPAALPLPRDSRAALQFSYARDPGGAEIALYNCDTFPGTPREQCIPRAR